MSWHRDEDGVLRHPRYPSGSRMRPSRDARFEYDAANNAGSLIVASDAGERTIPLTFWEMQSLWAQLRDVIREAQKENARLYAEKEAIDIEAGILPRKRGIR